MGKRSGGESGKILAATVAWALVATPAFAQHKYTEGFEGAGEVLSGQQGPQGLIDAGWTFRNQSDPGIAGTPAWLAEGGGGWARTGSGFLRSTSSPAGQFFAEMSHWAILPAVPGQASGDILTVWALDGGKGTTPTYLDIRYSPSGGTATGSEPDDVGDFTELLFTGELPLEGTSVVYNAAEAVIPGDGRIALRFHSPLISNFPTTANIFLDDLTIGGPAGPPCGLDLPAPGESVTWGIAGSPYTICQTLILPEGATLTLEPGVTVLFEPGHSLIVRGSIVAQGTSTQPVRFVGDNVSGIELRGEAILHHADVDAGIHSISFDGGCTLEAYDCIFRPAGWISAGVARSFTRLERCEIQSEVLSLHSASVVAETRVTNPAAFVSVNGLWNIQGIESDAPILFYSYLQDRVVDRVTITGVADGPAIELYSQESSTEFHLGPSNVIQGNLYPVWPRFAGLTPDSTIPATGNINNAILGMDVVGGPLRSRVSIPNFGIPYHFPERGHVRGDVRIDPGTVLKFGPLGGLTVSGDNGTDGTLRGLPGQPVVLERLDPGLAWFSLATGPGWPIFEHLDVSGAGVGIVGNEAELFLRDSIIHDCEIGAYPAADGNIYGSGVEFRNNQLGLRDDPVSPQSQVKTGVRFSGVERPNIFEGNVLAAKNFGTTNGTLHKFYADHNWWGHTTGPYEKNFHPQGQGDEVSFGVDFQPFLTKEPDLSDARPVVRLKTRLHPAIHPGEKVIVEWEAFDDGTIESFDVLVLDPNINLPPGFFFLELAKGLPGSARSFEVIVPDVGLHPYERFPFRIVAHDDAGNTGFEQFWFSIPHQRPSATVVFSTVFGEFRGGEDVEICYDALDLSAGFPQFYIETAADDRVGVGPAGPAGIGQCAYSKLRIPHASTDRARVGLRSQGNFNRDEWYFTDYFTIRPDPRLGDAPPEITVLSPQPGQSFVGGGIIPIAWTASDDIGIREFRIQASFNGGYTFHTIEPALPPGATSHDWRLPASTGIDDVRIRVVAVDTMMQNSSDGDQGSITILPGSSCYADCEGDGDLDIFDFLCFQGAYAGQQSYADCEQDGDWDVFDFLCFQGKYAGGCQ